MNAKIVAVGLVIAILVAALFLSGIIPGFHLPQKTQLISVSQVNLEPGGSLQGKYVVNTYWNVLLTTNSYQNVALSQVDFGSQNASQLSGNTVNGQTVVPTSQVYVTIDPLQPYATLSLVERQTTFAPNANGVGNPVSIVNCAIECEAQGTKMAAQSQSLTYYIPDPNDATWTYHYPVQITVEKLGPNPFTSTQTIDAATVSQVKFTNPNNSSEAMTINTLGMFQGSKAAPSINNPVFFQGTNGGTTTWYGFNNGLQGIETGFPSYWYGSQTSFNEINGQSKPATQFWPNGVCDAQVHPGWQQNEVYIPSRVGPIPVSYFYSPVTPSLSANVPASSSTSLIYTEGGSARSPSTYFYEISTVCGSNLPMSLTSYLGYAGYSQYSWSPYGLSNWGSINSTTLVENLPFSATNAVNYPTMQILISTSLVNTVIYQVNNVQFKFNSVTASASSVESGAPITITAVVSNPSTYTGTATVTAADSLGLLDLSPISQSKTIAPGGTASMTFTVTGLYTTKSVTDTLDFSVQNNAFQITDTKAIQIAVIPQPTAGSPNFQITKVSPPSSVAVGSSGTLTLSILNLGGSGTAQLSETSESPQVASITPENMTQEIGSGTTAQIPLTVVGLSTNKAQNVTFDITVTGGSQPVSTKVTVLITPAVSVPCQLTNSCATNSGPDYPLYLTLAAIVAGAIIVAAIVVTRRK